MDPYLVIKSNNVNDLTKEVNSLYPLGYRPTGGITAESDDGYFYQAIFREERIKLGDIIPKHPPSYNIGRITLDKFEPLEIDYNNAGEIPSL